jgi:ADP-ribose pyrophosphatase YjhB (NUDIX family)
MPHGNELGARAGGPSGLGQSGATAALRVREYTCGFLFWRSDVLLVIKNHPDWQVGLANGIGGEAHEGEDPLDCMRREFQEETGLGQLDWSFFCHETGRGYSVHYFRAEVPRDVPRPVPPVGNDRGEMLGWADVGQALRGDIQVRLIGNLKWLIPMAQDWRGVRARVVADRDIVEQPTW